MLEIDHLRIADFYEWLGCQKLAAERLGCNQSTVSRRAREAKRFAAAKNSDGTSDFLRMERHLYQRWRFMQEKDLRLHSYLWINHLLREEIPESWTINPTDVSETAISPIELLDNHVIDALLAPWPVVAGLDRRRFALLAVYFMPLVLLAPVQGALACDTGWNEADIAMASGLGRLDFVPQAAWDCSRHLDQQLFGRPQLARAGQPRGAMPAWRRQPAEAGYRQAETRQTALPSIQKRYWGTSFTTLIRPDLTIVDYESPIVYGEFLVCLRDWTQHGQMMRLLEVIRSTLALQHRDCPHLESIAIA